MKFDIYRKRENIKAIQFDGTLKQYLQMKEITENGLKLVDASDENNIWLKSWEDGDRFFDLIDIGDYLYVVKHPSIPDLLKWFYMKKDQFEKKYEKISLNETN